MFWKKSVENKEQSEGNTILWLSMRSEFESFISLRSETTARQYTGVLREVLTFAGFDFNSIESAPPIINRETALKFIQHCKVQKGQRGRIPGVPDTVTHETVKRKAVILARIWKHWQQCGLVTENPWNIPWPQKRKSTASKRPTRLIPFNLVRDIINSPDSSKEGVRDRALLSALFAVGLRRKEVSGLRVGSMVKAQSGTSVVRLIVKGGFVQEKPVAEWAAEAIHKLITQRLAEGASLDDYLFTRYLGKPSKPTNAQLSESTIYRMFKGYCAANGLDHKTVSPHCARATAITKLLADGHDYNDVREFAGHASIQTTQRYDKRVSEIERSVGKKIDY